MRVFKDKKAVKRFGDLYQTLSPNKQRIMGQKVRDLANRKIVLDAGEFYVTIKDLNEIYKSMI